MVVSPPPHGALIRVAGADAESFLQGQLSHDMRALGTDHATLSSLNGPKGRVLATLVVLRLGDEVGLLLAPDIAEAMLKRLRMFVLRSKVTLTLDEAPVGGLVATGDAAQEADWAVARDGDGWRIRAPGHPARWWVAGTTGHGVETTDPDAFAAADIAAGLPCIGAAQTEAHVAQHIGLQHFGALAFDKGCFTGQEVIARLHFRGGVNRVPVRLRGPGTPPAPGSALRNADGKALAEVVNSVGTADGCEVLAVWRGTELPGAAETAEARYTVVPFDR